MFASIWDSSCSRWAGSFRGTSFRGTSFRGVSAPGFCPVEAGLDGMLGGVAPVSSFDPLRCPSTILLFSISLGFVSFDVASMVRSTLGGVIRASGESCPAVSARRSVWDLIPSDFVSLESCREDSVEEPRLSVSL